MDVTPRGLLLNWVPHLPKFLKTTVLAALGLSETAEYQDFITQVVVQAARPVLQTPTPLHKAQDFFSLDYGTIGRLWVAKYTIPAPLSTGSDGEFKSEAVTNEHKDALTVEEAVKFAIDVLATTPEELECPVGTVEDVGVEWVAYRKGVSPTAALPQKSEREIYDLMMQDLDEFHTPTIIYCHGGAFCLMDPANHRFTTSTLAQHSHARVVSVRYRLSPQNIFPAALIDMFVTYLSLIAPPPGAFHKPVDAKNIILAGDSSGANLATTLQLLLSTLTMHRKNRIRWHNNSIVTIPDRPTAALSMASPYLDITRSLPSCSLNARWDIIAPPVVLNEQTISTSPPFPPDDIWPASPPRTETYCTAVMCAHPLVTPFIAPKHLLRCLPPVYISVGWEGMTDEAEVFARRIWEAKSFHDDSDDAHSNGQDSVHLCFEGYAGMPHSFSVIPFNKIGKVEIRRRTEHMVRAVAAAHGQTSWLEKKQLATWTNSKTMEEKKVPFKELGGVNSFPGYVRKKPLTEEDVMCAVKEGRDFRVRLEKKMGMDANEKTSVTTGMGKALLCRFQAILYGKPLAIQSK